MYSASYDQIHRASRQAADLDKEKIKMEIKIKDIEKELSCRVRERRKLEDEVKDLRKLIEKLKADIIEKDTCLDHLQKQSDELRSSLSISKNEVIKEFKTSSEFTDILDKNYAAGFKDFCMDTVEAFLGVDFKLPTVAKSSLL